MSVCYRLVLDSVCRSNHHRLAVMALEHLQADDASGWRDLFLKHRDTYLKGAKAPDEEFKDFKNHVLHVRDGDWGGAPAAAREWYRRTVRAMREKDWKHAAWCAGVMSHYVVDPVQPFHTGQTEEEGVIHRAAEWSFSKAFPELLGILENDLGYPDVPVPAGEDWLEKMVRAGAGVANKHYETVLDHYDIEAGRRRPQDGLDQELKDVIAALIGYAAVMLSRVIDRAILDAKAEAPKVSLALDAAGIWLAAPKRALARHAENAAERAIVAAQYAEFRRTGKVRETLSDDDKAVRRLHAEEVLKVSLSSLDCQWPRETGTAHGQGAEPRPIAKRRRRSAEEGRDAATANPSPLWGGAGVGGASTKGSPPQRSAGRQRDLTKNRPSANAARPPTPAPPHKGEGVAAALRQPKSTPRIRLTRDASVVDAPSIGPKTAGRLSVIGVKTVADLLALSPDEAARQIKQSHINARIIKDWQAQALLACSVPELSGAAAQLLVGAGVTSIEDLATSDLDALTDAVDMFAASNEGERALRSSPVPNRDAIKSWIESALAICEGRSAA